MRDSRDVFVPVTADVPSGVSFTPEDLSLGWAFPDGWFSSRISVVPGTEYPLVNHYRIFVSRDDINSYFNQSVARAYDRPWYGNIVVAKYARGDLPKLAHVAVGERCVIDVIVGARVFSISIRDDGRESDPCFQVDSCDVREDGSVRVYRSRELRRSISNVRLLYV